MVSEERIKKILIVDDDPVIVKLLDGILTDNGYQVDCAEEADQGLQKAMHDQPDLILLDVMMPIINGFNFCRLLKSEEGQEHILIILLTSRDEKEDIEIGLKMGADAYMVKPINTEELLKTIHIVASMKNGK